RARSPAAPPPAAPPSSGPATANSERSPVSSQRPKPAPGAWLHERGPSLLFFLVRGSEEHERSRRHVVELGPAPAATAHDPQLPLRGRGSCSAAAATSRCGARSARGPPC